MPTYTGLVACQTLLLLFRQRSNSAQCLTYRYNRTCFGRV